MRLVSRLLLLCLFFSPLAPSQLYAQTSDNQKKNMSKQLYEYLLGEAQQGFDARRAEIRKLATPTDVEERQGRIRKAFLDALGTFPEKTPLNAKMVGTINGDGYHIEKVIYESRPNHHVTAVLFVPSGKGPFPGVLMPCGHSKNGKADATYQTMCIALAKNGFVVLSYDPIGQGERSQVLKESALPLLDNSVVEHTMVHVGALLVGRCTAHYRIWDGIRSIDYLVSRPEVDPKRIGCTGNSGGGTLTSYLMALDDRIYAAAPSCYITSLERLFNTIGPQDGEQNIPGQVAFGLEHADYITLRAPKPTLICIGTKDYFDWQGAWTSYREAKLQYGILGHGERVDLFEFNDTHGFSKPRREAALRWMQRWLQNRDGSAVEPSITPLKDTELQCTRTGQVVEDLKGRTVVDFNAEQAKELSVSRREFLAKANKDELTKTIKRLIGWREPVAGKLDLKASVFSPEPGIALDVRCEGDPQTESAVIFLEDGVVDNLARRGKPGSHWHLALRGMGGSAPSKPAPTGLTQIDPEWKEAFLAFHVNRPLIGQRVFDLCSLIRSLKASGVKHVHVVAGGKCGIVALHAAAVDANIDVLSLDRTLLTWNSVAGSKRSLYQLSSVIPGVLAYYDLPDLLRLVSARHVECLSPVDEMGVPVKKQEAENMLAPALGAYRQTNGKFTLEVK